MSDLKNDGYVPPPVDIPGIPDHTNFHAEVSVGVGIHPDGKPRYACVLIFTGFHDEASATAFGDKLVEPTRTWIENTYARRQS